MLALAEIEERHDSSFLVLWWVALEDLVYEALILRGEFEGDRGIVVVGISVLSKEVSRLRKMSSL